MSVWIKVEKSLVTDPRFLRMAKSLRNADVTHQRINPAWYATQVLGGLTQLWIYADTHIREDDTLDLGPDEINEVVGIEGFAQLMPPDWLEVIDANCVKLPGFHDHNGTEAKKKALTQKRVARHRVRSVTQERNDDTPACNAGALPDQTRPDQTRQDQKQEARAKEVPHGTRDAEVFDAVATLKAKYPPNAIRENWIAAEKAARQLVAEGDATWTSLTEAVERYARVCRATNRAVMNPANFFTAEDKPWSQRWPMPTTKAQAAQNANVDASLAWLAEQEARDAAG